MIWFVIVFGLGCLITCSTKLNLNPTDKPYGVTVEIFNAPTNHNDH